MQRREIIIVLPSYRLVIVWMNGVDFSPRLKYLRADCSKIHDLKHTFGKAQAEKIVSQ